MGIRHLYPYNSGTPVSGGSTPVFGISGYPTVSIQLVGSMAAGEYTPQVSNDGGQTWADIQVVSSSGTAASTIDGVGAYRVDANGFSSFRLLPDENVTADHVIYMFASEEPFSRPGTGGGAASEVDLIGIDGASPSTGNGTAGSGTLRVAIASNNTAFGVNLAQYTPASGRLPVDGSGVTQPVSAASLPLPTGAATAANQATGNASLATLAGAVAGTEMQVDILTLPATPAGTNLIGRVSASMETSTLYSGTTAITPKFAAVSASASGNNTLVAAVPSNHIRVLSGVLMAAGTVNATFQTGAGGTPISGAMPLVANVGFTIPFNPYGNFETATNTLLNLSLDAAVAVTGWITYVEVP